MQNYIILQDILGIRSIIYIDIIYWSNFKYKINTFLIVLNIN